MGVYGLRESSGAVEFSATPMILGVTAIVAGLPGTRYRVTATLAALSASRRRRSASPASRWRHRLELHDLVEDLRRS